MKRGKRVRFNEQVDEKLIPRAEDSEDDEEEQGGEEQVGAMHVEDDGDAPTILAGATMEELISQMEPGLWL